MFAILCFWAGTGGESPTLTGGGRGGVKRGRQKKNANFFSFFLGGGDKVFTLFSSSSLPPT